VPSAHLPPSVLVPAPPRAGLKVPGTVVRDSNNYARADTVVEEEAISSSPVPSPRVWTTVGGGGGQWIVTAGLRQGTTGGGAGAAVEDNAEVARRRGCGAVATRWTGLGAHWHLCPARGQGKHK
jgi:hypothetical protein